MGNDSGPHDIISPELQGLDGCHQLTSTGVPRPWLLLDLPLQGVEKGLTGTTTGCHMLFPWVTWVWAFITTNPPPLVLAQLLRHGEWQTSHQSQRASSSWELPSTQTLILWSRWCCTPCNPTLLPISFRKIEKVTLWEREKCWFYLLGVSQKLKILALKLSPILWEPSINTHQ